MADKLEVRSSEQEARENTNKPKSKKWLWWVLGVIVVAAIGAGAYYYWNKSKTTTTPSTTTTLPTATTTTPTTTTPAATTVTTPTTTVATADWKTYENKGFNFSVKYPADWDSKVLQEDANGTLQVSFNPNSQNKKFIGNPGMIITAAKIGDSTNSIDTVNCKQSNSSKVSLGVNSVVMTKMSCENGDIKVYYGEITNNKINYSASGMQSGDNKVIDTFDQILSTFKFTN